MNHRSWPASLQVMAVLLAGLLAIGCTKEVERPSIETKTFAIDWNRIPGQVFEARGLSVQGIVLMPSTYPMEESLRSLLKGNFIGVIDKFNVQFQSGTIPPGVLQDLYGAGFVPAYVRIANLGNAPISLDTASFVVSIGDGATLENATPDALPDRFKELSGEQTAKALGVTVLWITVIVLAAELGGNPGQALRGPNFDAFNKKLANVPMKVDDGLVRSGPIPPGEGKEGLLFFRRPSGWLDWAQAKLAIR